MAISAAVTFLVCFATFLVLAAVRLVVLRRPWGRAARWCVTTSFSLSLLVGCALIPSIDACLLRGERRYYAAIDVNTLATEARRLETAIAAGDWHDTPRTAETDPALPPYLNSLRPVGYRVGGGVVILLIRGGPRYAEAIVVATNMPDARFAEMAARLNMQVMSESYRVARWKGDMRAFIGYIDGASKACVPSTPRPRQPARRREA